MKFTYLGHACFYIEINGSTILFDPFIRPNELAKDIDFQALKADYIFLSHAHADHVADAIDLAKQTKATIVASWEICSWANKNGIHKTHPMNIGGEWNFDFGKTKMVHATHSSSFEDGSYGGPAAGFVISSNDRCFYYSGDTSLNADMKLLPELVPPIDFAVLPIGNNFTMGYQEASMVAAFVKTNKVIGVHYDTFGYIKIDHNAAKNHFKSNNQELILLQIGASITI
jgi:L-ascorbate metabolism protein UlaG (beta-lactamase superfamily)